MWIRHTGVRAVLTAIALAALAASSACHELAKPAAPATSAIRFPAAEAWTQTELFFGLTRRDGSLIPDWDWQAFVDRVVTPEFPDGFTVIGAQGQYLDTAKKRHREPSRIVVLLYPANQAASNEEKIRRIVTAYIREFDQEAVLRADAAESASLIMREDILRGSSGHSQD